MTIPTYLYKKIINDIKPYEQEKITTAELRRIIKSYLLKIKDIDIQDRHNLILSLYKRKQSGAGIFATAIIHSNISEIKPQKFKWLDQYLDYFDSWGTTDDFCLNVIQPLLTKYKKETLSLLKNWNGSKNMWKRRASVVAFVRKVGESGKFTNKALELCEGLIWDKENLVQKGVGWCLKDTMRGNRKKVFEYVKKLRKQGVSAIIILYAIRDLKGTERTKILQVSKPRTTSVRGGLGEEY